MASDDNTGFGPTYSGYPAVANSFSDRIKVGDLDSGILSVPTNTLVIVPWKRVIRENTPWSRSSGASGVRAWNPSTVGNVNQLVTAWVTGVYEVTVQIAGLQTTTPETGTAGGYLLLKRGVTAGNTSSGTQFGESIMRLVGGISTAPQVFGETALVAGESIFLIVYQNSGQFNGLNDAGSANAVENYSNWLSMKLVG